MSVSNNVRVYVIYHGERSLSEIYQVLDELKVHSTGRSIKLTWNVSGFAHIEHGMYVLAYHK